MEKNKVVIDVETKKTFSEVGGLQSNHHLLGISFAGVYSYSQDKYFGFLEKELPVLEKILIKTRPQIIGFNTKGFDNKVMQPYFKGLKIDDLPQLDILEEIHKELGFRIKLESTAQATLGEGKTGTGLDAIRYFKEKDFDSLAKYCMDDVRITKELFEYGRNHGKLFYMGGGEKRAINIKWGDAPDYFTIIKQAYRDHQRLKIKYFKLDDKNNKEIEQTEIDVLDIQNDNIIAYCHTRGKKREFNVYHVLDIKITGDTYAHQTSLI